MEPRLSARVRRIGEPDLSNSVIPWPQAGGERDGLQTCRFSRPAIGISRKLIAVNSLIQKQCLHGPGCHPFRYLSGSRGFPSIIGRRLERYLSAPSPKKRLLPFHFGLPCGSAVVYGFGRSR
jgi:hypothetical protein